MTTTTLSAPLTDDEDERLAVEAFLADAAGDLLDLVETADLEVSPQSAADQAPAATPTLDFTTYPWDDPNIDDLSETQRDEIRAWPGHRFDFASLLTAVRLDATEADVIAEIFGCHRRTIGYWHSDGLDSRQADRLAVKAGTVPELVWPEFLEVIEMEELRRLVSKADARERRLAKRRAARK